MSLVSLSLKMGEEGGGEGGVVVVGPPTSSTVIQRRWEGLTPGVAALLSWSGLTGTESCAQFIPCVQWPSRQSGRRLAGSQARVGQAVGQ